MTNEENKITGNEEESGLEMDYIAEIQKLKSNTVPKEAYDAMLEENRKLLSSLVNGEGVSTETQKDDGPSIPELRAKIFDRDNQLSNLEYIEGVLELREKIIAKGDIDPFLPYGVNIAPTDEDVQCANRVAAGLKQCVEYANGDSNIFTNELQRIMVDTSPRRGR